ncbi:hypothetical protein [Methylorubrum aminovorans]|uniref:hypothetical protein n=1 Tax=Methylorubrum aminovorans TaxID=269069 RepID=UPI001EE030CA|nr:hypothetical protein [Methylorubrum aminovorans]GMA79296.1 hypothetical protein GCM10025880_57130 [Methylorubrum aminovorans]
MSDSISKQDAARRLIEASIDLFFDAKDSLVVYNLAYSAFKVLYDLYSHHQKDDFAKQIDAALGKKGWQHMSGTANFLKHADKDPQDVLEHHHPFQSMVILVLAVIMYRRTFGESSVKMMAFDYWTDELVHDEIGIREVDENPGRAEFSRNLRKQIQELPFDQQIIAGKALYEQFIEHYESVRAAVELGQEKGLTITEIIDQQEEIYRQNQNQSD